jgi:hypothetical protein
VHGHHPYALEDAIEHAVSAIGRAAEYAEPFHHLELDGIFPAALYAAMVKAMPEARHYRLMSGRARYTRTAGGGGTRTKMDLFPEYLRHLAPKPRTVWQLVGAVLTSPEVREAFRRRLAPGLERRFGPRYREVGMYAVPVLTRDVPGYRIGVHPDTRSKAMTIQIYLPRDRRQLHVGTVFHGRGAQGFERSEQMLFAPNSGYAFAVGEDTYHSVDPVGAEVTTRDSILLTYYVDDRALETLRNRAKRLGNFVLNELRALGAA